MAPPVYKRLDKDNCLFLFVDHQTGLLTLVRDFGPDEFQNSLMLMVRLASHFKIPSILTTSFDSGPNGPILEAIPKRLPDAPLIRRPGEVNAMDNPDFAALVKKSGKKQIVIGGILTEICVAYPVLTLIEQGYDVFVATDACGTFAEHTREAAHKRMAAAGAQLVNVVALSGELQMDWRHDAEGFGAIWNDHMPAYGALYQNWQNAKNQK